MYKKYHILGLIPARGTNDEVDHLNIKELGGKPMIVYSIKEALSSRYIDRLIVSTEDRKTASISERAGAEIPFRRPAALCVPEVELSDVVRHALENLREKFDIVATLFSNAPFRTCKDIDNAIRLLIENRFETVVSVEEKRDYYWMENQGKVQRVNHLGSGRRKDCTPLYVTAGGIVVIWVQGSKSRDFFDDGIGLHIMKEHNARTITSLYDLLVAERLVKIHSNLIDELVNSK